MTAISRKNLPLPVRWLRSKSMIQGKVLDYGCGKCATINPAKWDSYDPYYAPISLKNKKYDTIVCNYVLNTLLPDQIMTVLKKIKKLLTDNGVAYISVRNDKPKSGWGYSSKGTYQCSVDWLPFKQVRTTNQYRIYVMTSKTSIFP